MLFPELYAEEHTLLLIMVNRDQSYYHSLRPKYKKLLNPFHIYFPKALIKCREIQTKRKHGNADSSIDLSVGA